jgi:hypothetical protein
MCSYGLNLCAGTITDGVQKLVLLFKPIAEGIIDIDDD